MTNDNPGRFVSNRRIARRIAIIGLALLFAADTLLLLTGAYHRRSHSGARLAKSRDNRPGSSSSEDAILQRLCRENLQDNSAGYDEDDLADNDPNAWKQVDDGIARARRMLPVARELTLQSLSALAADFDLDPDQLRRAREYVMAVNRVLLDKDLEDSAEVRDDAPDEIRIGPQYGLVLTNDDATVLLLGHELTHVAAWSHNLHTFFEKVAQTAQQTAAVYPDRSQKPDLSCDFIGEQVVKRFIKQRPTSDSAALRFSRALDYNCGPHPDDDGDEEHLSQGETLRALLGLDPELSGLILGKTVASRSQPSTSAIPVRKAR